MNVTNNDIVIDTRGKWIFQNNEIINLNILNYFKKNLSRDKHGYYIINQFGDKFEKGYLKRVEYFPLIVQNIEIKINKSIYEYFLTLDYGQTVQIEPKNVFYFNENTLALLLNDNVEHPLFARLSALCMTQLIDAIELNQNENYSLRTSLYSENKKSEYVELNHVKMESLYYYNKKNIDSIGT